MKVNMKLLRRALVTAPTPTWRAGLNTCLGIVEANAVPVHGDVYEVDGKAWMRAMNICWRLPSGGRWVWKFRESLGWAIQKATKEV